MADLDYLRNKWDAINAMNFYKKIIISPFHMLNKSENLRYLLEHIYGSEIPKENELVTKINLKDEILHYGN
jgi:Txe/YoeB family toxin of Txe-Axe toxin-antitoxin module